MLDDIKHKKFKGHLKNRFSMITNNALNPELIINYFYYLLILKIFHFPIYQIINSVQMQYNLLIL